MKKLALAMACLFAVGVAQADDKGGFSQDAAPPPPHKLDDGYRGVEDGRIMTVEQAKTMHDGATVSLRGNLLKRQGDDRYQFRDKSGTITVIIPVAAFNEQHVEPDDLVNINGSLDRKMTPPVVRIDRLLKQSPKKAEHVDMSTFSHSQDEERGKQPAREAPGEQGEVPRKRDDSKDDKSDPWHPQDGR